MTTDKSITMAYGDRVSSHRQPYYSVREKGPKNGEPQSRTQRYGNATDYGDYYIYREVLVLSVRI